MVDRGNSRRWRDALVVDERIKSQVPIGRMTELPEDFQPNVWTVICGRGRESYDSSKYLQNGIQDGSLY